MRGRFSIKTLRRMTEIPPTPHPRANLFVDTLLSSFDPYRNAAFPPSYQELRQRSYPPASPAPSAGDGGGLWDQREDGAGAAVVAEKVAGFLPSCPTPVRPCCCTRIFLPPSL
eukprot:3590755-Rhodomonas_salina.2